MINLFLPTHSRRADDSGAGYGSGTPGFGPLADFWYTMTGRPTASRINVTEDVAMTYSACWAATRLLSGTGGMLPFNLYRRDPGASDERQDDKEFILYSDPRNSLMDNRPNEEMGAMMFRAQGFNQQINSGNCYSEIERYEDGTVAALWPIHHSRVRIVRDKQNGQLWYEVKNDAAKPTYIAPADMLHVPSMMSRDGIVGMGVITAARESIGMGIATERYGATWFGSGGVPRIAITHPAKLSPEARMNFRKEWKEIYGGAEGDKVALVAEGASIVPLNINNDDAQFLATRQHNIEEIARWYGVPPHMLQHLLRATFSNIEHLGIEFVVYSLLPWLKLWEQECWAKLLTPEEQQTMFFRFNVNELLRGDSKTRSEYIRTMVSAGILSPDEGRIMEGLNPVGGANANFYMQGAMMPIDKLGMQPAAPAPKDTSAGSPDPENADDAQKQDEAAQQRQTAIVLRAMTEQSQSIETRTQSAVAATVNSLRDELTAKLDSIASAKDARENVLRTVARTMLARDVSIMLRHQAVAAKQASRKPDAFLAWLDKFFDDDHRRNFQEAIAPVVGALAALGIVACAKSLAEREVSRSREELLKLSGECSAKDLPATVERAVDAWEKERAQAVCEAVIGGQAA